MSMRRGAGMDKNAVYQTNSRYWDTKGNDFLEAIVPIRVQDKHFHTLHENSAYEIIVCAVFV